MEERERIIRGLEALAGLMACYAAMEDRPRRYADPRPRAFPRTDGVSDYWREVA